MHVRSRTLEIHIQVRQMMKSVPNNCAACTCICNSLRALEFTRRCSSKAFFFIRSAHCIPVTSASDFASARRSLRDTTWSMSLSSSIACRWLSELCLKRLFRRDLPVLAALAAAVEALSSESSPCSREGNKFGVLFCRAGTDGLALSVLERNKKLRGRAEVPIPLFNLSRRRSSL